MQDNFSLSVTVDNATGKVLAVYFQLRSGKSAKSKELADGKVIADYNRSGRLIGVEMLAPCTVKVLDQIEIDEDARTFIKRSAPREFVRGPSRSACQAS